MRILAITNLYPNPLEPHRGTFNRQQFRALADRHDVRLIVPISWTDEFSARQHGGRALAADRSASCDGLDIDHPRYWFTPRMCRSQYGRCYRQSIGRTFARACSEFHPDLILAAWAYPDGWAANALGHAVNLPVVIKVHGSDILTLPKVRGREKPTAAAMRNADGVIAVSHDLATRVVQMGANPRRVSVVYDGIDFSRFHPGSKVDARQRVGVASDEPLILFVGNLKSVKGLDVLIDACTRLSSQGKSYRCVMIGEGPLRPSLQTTITQAGLADRVKLIGPVLHGDLPDWFRAADVLVLPSRSEGVPCVLLEAAACQTPFVASRVGGIPEIAHINRGEMVTPGDADALARGIIDVLADPTRGAPARPFARSHADAANEIAAFCEKVAASHQRRSRRHAVTTPRPTTLPANP